MSDSSPINLWSQIPYLERDATLEGPSRNLAGEYAALADDLVVKSESVLPLIGAPDIQLKTSSRPLTSTRATGLDPISQTSQVHVRTSNQNPEASGLGPGAAIWRRSGGSGGAPTVWKQGEMTSFLEGINLPSGWTYAVAFAALGWAIASETASLKSKALLWGAAAGGVAFLAVRKAQAAAPPVGPE